MIDLFNSQFIFQFTIILTLAAILCFLYYLYKKHIREQKHIEELLHLIQNELNPDYNLSSFSSSTPKSYIENVNQIKKLKNEIKDFEKQIKELRNQNDLRSERIVKLKKDFEKRTMDFEDAISKVQSNNSNGNISHLKDSLETFRQEIKKDLSDFKDMKHKEKKFSIKVFLISTIIGLASVIVGLLAILLSNVQSVD